MRLLPLIFMLAGSLAASEPTEYPLWDGSESVAEYAKRVNLPPSLPVGSLSAVPELHPMDYLLKSSIARLCSPDAILRIVVFHCRTLRREIVCRNHSFSFQLFWVRITMQL